MEQSEPPTYVGGGASLADRIPVQAAIVVVGGLLVPALVTLVVWLSAQGGDDGPRRAAQRGAAASTAPLGGVLGSRSASPRATGALHLTFDEALIGTPVEGWIVDPGAAFTVAPRPSSAERSALLETQRDLSVSACYPLFSSDETVVFEATFQLAGATAGDLPLLDLATADETTLTLMAAGEELLLGDSRTVGTPNAWHRWSVLVGRGGSYEMTLSREGGDEVVRAAGESSAIVIESFCATVRPGMSLYLDRVALTPEFADGG